MYHRILVILDSSGRSEEILTCRLLLGQDFACAVHVLVMSPATPPGTDPSARETRSEHSPPA